MTIKYVIVIDCNSQSEAERTRDWLAYYSFGPDRVSIVEHESETPGERTHDGDQKTESYSDRAR